MRSGAVGLYPFFFAERADGEAAPPFGRLRAGSFAIFKGWGEPVKVRLRRPVGDSAWAFSPVWLIPSCRPDFAGRRGVTPLGIPSPRQLAILAKPAPQIFPYVESPPTTVPLHN